MCFRFGTTHRDRNAAGLAVWQFGGVPVCPAGQVEDGDAWQFGGVPVSPAGQVEDGGDSGTAESDGEDCQPEPRALTAVTTNVYETPLVKPPTVIGEADPVALAPPGVAVTV